MLQRRKPLVRTGGPKARAGTPRRRTTGGRARPADPLASWCAAQISGVCTGRAEHRHHKLPRSAGGDDTPENTTDLCGACHRYVHAHPTFGYESGYLIRRSTNGNLF